MPFYDSISAILSFKLHNAKVLPESQQQQIFDLVNNQEVADILNDPFGLKLKDELNSLSNLPEDSAINF